MAEDHVCSTKPCMTCEYDRVKFGPSPTITRTPTVGEFVDLFLKLPLEDRALAYSLLGVLQGEGIGFLDGAQAMWDKLVADGRVQR